MEDIVERLRKDIAEWKRLGEICERPKVKEGIEIEVRRAETALIKEMEKRDLNSAKSDAEKKTVVTTAAARSYDVQIKNYCKGKFAVYNYRSSPLKVVHANLQPGINLTSSLRST